MADGLVQRLADAITDRRNDPNTPRCAKAYCKGPAMMMVQFRTREGVELRLDLCEDHHDGLLWASNGYMPNIKRICEGWNLSTGQQRETSAGRLQGETNE